jgi:hypothetical protein
MYVPTNTLTISIFLLCRTSITSLAMPPSSSSLSPPRLFTIRTTRSLPSPVNFTKERSGSFPEMSRPRRFPTSSFREGIGETVCAPGSLWIPSPISISLALIDDDEWPDPGTCGKFGVRSCYGRHETIRTWQCSSPQPIVTR